MLSRLFWGGRGGADIYWPMMTLIFFFGGKREEVDRTIGTIGTKGAKETTIDKSPGRSAETTERGTKKKKTSNIRRDDQTKQKKKWEIISIFCFALPSFFFSTKDDIEGEKRENK